MGSVAIVQDHLVQAGGAERVLLSMAKAFPNAPIYTAFYWPEVTYDRLRELDIRTLPLDRVPGLRKHHRAALPLMAPAYSRLQVDADVVLACSSGWAAGAKTRGRKIIYFHALARWLYEPDSYVQRRSVAARTGLAALRRQLIAWDKRAVATGARYLVNSSAEGARVKALYDVDAEVLPPPLTIDASGPQERVPGIEPGFYLCPCRLLPYKNVEAVVEAFRGLPQRRLVVAGGGPELDRIRRVVPANVVVLGAVRTDAMRWLYANSLASVSAAYEPYGIAPLESAAFGKPSVVLRAGGFLDTVVEGRTGLFFDRVDPATVATAIRQVEKMDVCEEALREHASRFGEEQFIDRLASIVGEELARYHPHSS